MTKLQFIESVEVKPNFLKWAGVETLIEDGLLRKYRRDAFVTTPDGFRNIVQVWYIEDTETGDTTFQNYDTLTPAENTSTKAQAALSAYLKATFAAYRLLWADLENNFAEAEVFSITGNDLARSKVLVFKVGSNPITHRVIV